MQNISELSGEELKESSWCNGVPILVNKRQGEAYRGLNASGHALDSVPTRGIPMGSNHQSENTMNPAFGLTARA